LKLSTPFTVVDGQEVDFTSDCGLRKSVHTPKGQKGPGRIVSSTESDILLPGYF